MRGLFPAHAGVFPGRSARGAPTSPLPRARGGISGPLRGFHVRLHSSPRTRGYFRPTRNRYATHSLFPAHAGVFPRHCRNRPRPRTLPRARGGISDIARWHRHIPRSSPRTRGYFRVFHADTVDERLFPAHAGVFPGAHAKQEHASTLPRARGGISGAPTGSGAASCSSPRTRGYFRCWLVRGVVSKLFPAHAGVFPHFAGLRAAQDALPRARGGISAFGDIDEPIECSSPRTRGYFRL